MNRPLFYLQPKGAEFVIENNNNIEIWPEQGWLTDQEQSGITTFKTESPGVQRSLHPDIV